MTILAVSRTIVRETIGSVVVGGIIITFLVVVVVVGGASRTICSPCPSDAHGSLAVFLEEAQINIKWALPNLEGVYDYIYLLIIAITVLVTVLQNVRIGDKIGLRKRVRSHCII